MESAAEPEPPNRLGPTVHRSVLPVEAIETLALRPGMLVVDGTMGGAGHTLSLAEQVGPTGRVLALDADAGAIERAAGLIGGKNIEPIHANFRDLPEVLRERGIAGVDAILVDLGLSSDQLADRERGFSFQTDGPLDLRFDVSTGESAGEMLERLDERRLADLIFEYGEERASRRIAREIVRQRRPDVPWTADRLAQLVSRCVPRSPQHAIHPATRTFQALRIAVNGELESLELLLRDSPSLLKPGGRLGVISFHSLEDRRVKEAFRDDPRWEVVTRKPIRPSDAEVELNPRSRTARLRVAARRDAVAERRAAEMPAAPKRFLGS